jgi:hypothetical protein
MTTRRPRKPAAPQPAPQAVEVGLPPGAWDDFSSKAPELTLEENEEVAVEVFLAASLADTFEAARKAEEENKTGDFFDPDFYREEIRHPAQPTDYVAEAPVPAPKRHPRYILRAETRRRKG